MDNYSKLSVAVCTWLRPRAMAILRQDQMFSTINEYLRNSGQLRTFINLFGIDLMQYDVVNELEFLIDPLIKQFGNRYMAQALREVKFISESDLLDIATEFVESAEKQAENSESGRVNIFGVLIDQKGLAELKELIEKEKPKTSKIGKDETDKNDSA